MAYQPTPPPNPNGDDLAKAALIVGGIALGLIALKLLLEEDDA